MKIEMMIQRKNARTAPSFFVTAWIFQMVVIHSVAAIVYPKAPAGGRQIAQQNAAQIRGPQMASITIAEPHQLYGIGLTNLASGHLLSAAQPAGWRYILMSGTNAVGVAELQVDTNTPQKLRFTGLDDTGFSSETLAAMRKAKELPRVKKQDYELRLLDIPAVVFAAVWLHGKSDDILIPLPPTFGRMKAYQPCSESQIIESLMPDAKKAMRSEKAMRGDR